MQWPVLANTRPDGGELAIVDEAHTVAEHTDVDLHGFWLIEVPDEGTVTVTDPAGPTGLVEVAGAPAAGQYRVHYSDEILGFVELNAADDALAVVVDYSGTGSAPEVGLLNALMAEKVDRDGSIPFTGRVTAPEGAFGGPDMTGKVFSVLSGGGYEFYALSTLSGNAFNFEGANSWALNLRRTDEPNSARWRVGPFLDFGLTFRWTNGDIDALHISTGGHLGLGTVSIEGWGNGNWRAIEWFRSSIAARTNGNIIQVISNAYLDGAGTWKYKSTDTAAFYSVGAGVHSFWVAGAGTTGTDVTWQKAMEVQNSGLILFPTTGYTFGNTVFRPTTDNDHALGSSGQRWTEVWAVDGSINTSARRLKNLLRTLDPAEGMEALRGLPVYEFTRKNRENPLRYFGPVLDEVPEWLRPNDDGESWALQNLVAMNTLAIQDLDRRLTEALEPIQH